MTEDDSNTDHYSDNNYYDYEGQWKGNDESSNTETLNQKVSN